MSDFIKNGFIEFKTLAPVYIGCGRTVNKKEYLYDTNTGEVIILQMNKVFERISKLGLADKFEKYLLSDPSIDRDTDRDLYGFVRSNHISEKEYRKWSDEIVRVADPSLNQHSIKDINLFIRNERGMPYISGSGFKGVLRTILETEYFLNNREQARKIAGQIKDSVLDERYHRQRREKMLKEEDDAADVTSMHRELFEAERNVSYQANIRNQKNDILRGLLVGDSDELTWDDMCICQKIDLNVNGEERNMNVLREAIKPGITIRIPVAIDTRVCAYTFQDILAAVKVFNRNYLDVFANKFSAAPRTRGNSTTFFLGGGTGYVSKTITYGILEKKDAVEIVSKIINETLGKEAKREHGHNKDVQKNVSPHIIKCTLYNNKLMQMGACCVTGYPM